MSPPLLFERRILAQRRARAARAPADFLLAHGAADAAERLQTVKRRFGLVADIGSQSGHARQVIAPLVDGPVLRFGPEAARPDVVADEEALPIAPGSLDLALSLLSLQFANDLPGALVQIRRALRPDGLFLVAMLGGASLSELRQAFAEAEIELEGGVSPRVLPFVDVRDLGGLLQRAGFALPVTDSETLTVRYDDVFALMADLRAMGGTNILAERRRAPTRRATLLRMAAIYGERFSDPDGRVRATFEIIWGSGWAPHDSQQKPLRPGSAQARLADALGVTEIRTPDKAGR